MAGKAEHTDREPHVTVGAAGRLGAMPVWDLSDLYPGPNCDAVPRDLVRASNETKRIKSTYQGKLAGLAKDATSLAEAIGAYERLSDTVGKLGSYAGLLYAGDTSNPENAKFHGDIQEKITAITTDLIFFELELNQIEEDGLASALRTPALQRYRPWFEDLRKEKPYQLEERLERLFHEKAIPSRAAWNRLFNETITALRFEVDGRIASPCTGADAELPDAPRRGAERPRREALAQVFKQNIRLFTLITNTLAKDKEISDRWRGFKDVADSRHLANRVEREVVEALVDAVRAAYPRTAHRYYAMKASGSASRNSPTGIAMRRCPIKPER